MKLTSTVEKAVVHRFMGARTSASSFLDCSTQAPCQRWSAGYKPMLGR